MTTKNINHCHFVGVVVGDPEVRELSNDRTTTSILIRVVEHVPNRNGGANIELVECVRVVGWNNLAKHLAKYATPGTTIACHGRLHTVARGFEIRLTEPVGVEIRACETCGVEFFVRDRGHRFCKPECNPSVADNLKPKLTEKGELKPLTPEYPPC
jgi:hypothetical protein